MLKTSVGLYDRDAQPVAYMQICRILVPFGSPVVFLQFSDLLIILLLNILSKEKLTLREMGNQCSLSLKG